jgi:cell division control protein 6
MADFSFEQDTQIYRDRDALTEDYTPNTLVGRDEELEEFHAALQPVINDENPSNIFLYGKSGVGKTAATRYLLGQLQDDVEEIPGVNVTVVEVNCDGLNTSYQTAIEIVNQLRPHDDQIASTGYPQSKVYQFLWEELDSCNGTVLIVLDEADHLNDDSILYQLTRARDNGNISDVNLGIIGISNDLTFREELSSKVRSSLCERVVSFSAYDANQLQQVLRQREEVAFYDDTLSEDVIPLCAAHGARESGDARRALDLLLMAGDLARKNHDDTVREDHVKQGKEEIEKEIIAEGIADLSEHARILLRTLMNMSAEDETPARTQEIIPVYRRLCEETGKDPVSVRSIRDNLAALSQLGITSRNEINQGRSGGKFAQHELVYQVDTVQYALASIEE